MKPLIFDIKRYAINDGPGIRITLFLKGCPLSCKWCHNPESQSPELQKLYSANKCIGAQECVKVCPNNALTLTPEGIITDTDACTLCGKCAEVCPARAIEMTGKNYEIAELMDIIERERVHIDQSGGGVTFSGGEPLMHPDFLLEMLKTCGQHKLHRTVDTCGFAASEILVEVAKHTDLFLYDLKLMDEKKHKKWTGVSNRLILKNLKLLAETRTPVNIRIPLIKNVNADEKSIREMAAFVSELNTTRRDFEIASPITVNLLPYHNIASGKYTRMGSVYNEFDMEAPSEKELERMLEIVESYGIATDIGG